MSIYYLSIFFCQAHLLSNSFQELIQQEPVMSKVQHKAPRDYSD